MGCTQRFHVLILGVALVAGSSMPAWAVPYASGVHDIGGNVKEFVLNQGAMTVKIKRDGGNEIVMTNVAAGRHTFDMTGFSNFDIEVTQHNNAKVWGTIGGQGNPFSNFTLPTGVAINKIPSSPYFGTVYVGQSNTTTTVAGRAMGDGIYSLTADMKGVDLSSNFAVVADANDTSQAKHPGFDVAAGLNASPWRLTLDAGGNLIVADWSDESGGIKYASPTLATGGRVLAGTLADGTPVADGGGTGPTGGVFSQEMDAFGRIPLHGSMAAKPYVTGTVGVDLTVWGMDEDLDVNLSTPPSANDGNSIWKWSVGSATDYDALAPDLVVNVGAIPATSDARSNFLNLNTGVSAGAHYDPVFNKWYLVEPRSNGDESCITVVTPDGVDGNTPMLEWSSLQFSIDNNLDPDAALAGIQDMFRRTREATISPDGKYLVVNRSSASSAVNGLGSGAVVLIPLDANGIPAIDVQGGLITNVETLQLINNNLGHVTGAQLEYDAAGNLYVSHSGLTTGNPALTAQLIQVLSPGGNSKATTSSGGTFDVQVTAGLPGDYNNDGKVDAADYVVWRDYLGVSLTQADYDVWRANFGAMLGSASGSSLAAVPEPGTLVLTIVGLCWLGMVRASRTRE